MYPNFVAEGNIRNGEPPLSLYNKVGAVTGYPGPSTGVAAAAGDPGLLLGGRRKTKRVRNKTKHQRRKTKHQRSKINRVRNKTNRRYRKTKRVSLSKLEDVRDLFRKKTQKKRQPRRKVRKQYAGAAAAGVGALPAVTDPIANTPPEALPPSLAPSPPAAPSPQSAAPAAPSPQSAAPAAPRRRTAAPEEDTPSARKERKLDGLVLPPLP